MTAQISEVLIYNGKKLKLHCTPIIPDNHPLIRHNTSQEESISSLCWRGYVGTWEIANRRLYLNSVDGKYIVTTPVFADWYCGTLVIPESDPGEYFHGGWGRSYAKNKLVTIVNGELTQVQYQNKKHPDHIDDWPKQRLNQVIGAIAEASEKLYLLADNNNKNRRMIAFTFEQKTTFESMAGKLFIAMQSCRQPWPISMTPAQPNTVGGNKYHVLAMSIPTLFAVELDQMIHFDHFCGVDDDKSIMDNIVSSWFCSEAKKPKAPNKTQYNKPPVDLFDEDFPF
ncbi:hypothetical protein [Enterovibrio paralichthyis]|uniref:hypothetical protein n=1 Tax=Enterovibrio paralichthyis TaxID=2853805 RepID=UPI001C45EDB1|nr:hypothetical protein [Enterovibrio paralichthyis]MBV7299359.1 hypothetical protein [Enterovibrio paralichthyis]